MKKFHAKILSENFEVAEKKSVAKSVSGKMWSGKMWSGKKRSGKKQSVAKYGGGKVWWWQSVSGKMKKWQSVEWQNVVDPYLIHIYICHCIHHTVCILGSEDVADHRIL